MCETSSVWAKSSVLGRKAWVHRARQIEAKGSAPEAVQCGCDLYGLRFLLQKDQNAKDVKGMQWWKSVVPVRQT